MKRRNKTRPDFNGMDAKSGYAVRFERSRDGTWWALPLQFVALGVGSTIRAAKKSVSEAIGWWLEDMQENGWPIPELEWKHDAKTVK
jgi:predicted RNase H-like HicB family nuclease